MQNSVQIGLNWNCQLELSFAIEVFNFKRKENQKIFKKLTSETSEFTNCFETNAPLNCQIENWRKLLKLYCGRSFQKIKIKKKRKIQINPKIAELINRKNEINLNQEQQLSEKFDVKEQIEKINEEISNLECAENRKKIIDNFKELGENPENINMEKMWKLLKKMWPKQTSKSTAKRNHIGKIISGPKEIKTLLSKEYKERLRKRPVRPDMAEILI